MSAALIAGFVLHALVCTKTETPTCHELPARHEATSLYVCQRAMAVAVERMPSAPPEWFAAEPVHVTFSCKPVDART